MHFLSQHLTREDPRSTLVSRLLVSFTLTTSSFQLGCVDCKIAMLDSSFESHTASMTNSSKGIALRFFWEGQLSFFDASTWLLPFYPSARTIGSSVEALPQREVEGKEWTSSCRNLEGICIGEEDRSYTFNFRYYDARYHLHLDSFWKLLFSSPFVYCSHQQVGFQNWLSYICDAFHWEFF